MCNLYLWQVPGYFCTVLMSEPLVYPPLLLCYIDITQDNEEFSLSVFIQIFISVTYNILNNSYVQSLFVAGPRLFLHSSNV